ncbi:hypothetical protein acdb102_00110 [Acidothermaceae bacterium B102]|nr:hypothetical protein acdb102_00110 [Acidothermaceae bacterium B102]
MAAPGSIRVKTVPSSGERDPYDHAVSSTDGPWGWRQRIVDARFPAMVCLGVGGGVLASAMFDDSGGSAVVGVVLVSLVCAAVALRALPKWRDPKHTPVAGAVVLYVGAGITLVAGLLAR